MTYPLAHAELCRCDPCMERRRRERQALKPIPKDRPSFLPNTKDEWEKLRALQRERNRQKDKENRLIFDD